MFPEHIFSVKCPSVRIIYELATRVFFKHKFDTFSSCFLWNFKSKLWIESSTFSNFNVVSTHVKFRR